MKTLEHILIALMILAVVWLAAGIGLVSMTIAWVTGLLVFGALVGGLVRFFTWQDNAVAVPPQTPRADFLARVTKYWYVWASALALSLCTTLLTIIACHRGWVIPVLRWGGRETPWLYVYTWQLLWWVVAINVGACFFSPEFSGRLGNRIGNWIRGGGFWRIWGIDNGPANSLLLLCVFILWLNVAGGLPTPSFDPAMTAWQAQGQASKVVNLPAVKEAEVSVGNYLSETFFNKTLFGKEAKPIELIKEPLPRYERGWLLFILGVFSVPLGLVAAAYCRRDGAADIIEKWLERHRAAKPVAPVTPTRTEGSPEQPPAESQSEITKNQVMVGMGFALLADLVFAGLERFSRHLRQTTA